MANFYEIVSSYITEAQSSAKFFDQIYDSQQGEFPKIVNLFKKQNLNQWPRAQDIFPITQETMSRANGSKLKPFIDVFPIIDLLWYIAEGIPSSKKDILNLSTETSSPSASPPAATTDTSPDSSTAPEGDMPSAEEIDKMSPNELREFLRRMLS